MKALTKKFTSEQAAQDFADVIWKILGGELTHSDDAEIQRYIRFFDENKPCDLILRKIDQGIEVGLKVHEDTTLDQFEDWGSAN